jgi:hypothetical protein
VDHDQGSRLRINLHDYSNNVVRHRYWVTS